MGRHHFRGADRAQTGQSVRDFVSERDRQTTRSTLETYLLPHEADTLLDGRDIDTMSAGALLTLRSEARRIGNARQEQERQFRFGQIEDEDRQLGAAPPDRFTDLLR